MIIVFAEQQNGKFKKAILEAVYYGRKLADQLGTTCEALVLGQCEDPASLGKYGANKVLQVNDENLRNFDSQVYTKVIAEVAKSKGASAVILSQTSTGKSLLGRLGVALEAGTVSGANTIPQTADGFVVNRAVYAGKAQSAVEVKTNVKIISLIGNSIQFTESDSAAEVEVMQFEVPAPKVRIKEIKREEGIVPLPEAELVVSAGRGMKGPENWGIIEELAEALNASTACSRPVSDMDWRPHHEHVGQTGIAIRPNLYIAIGISGAIQHLAGVNSSKVIVVINKDPEAPFFKAADYGVCADLFDVVPRLTAAVKKYKAG